LKLWVVFPVAQQQNDIFSGPASSHWRIYEVTPSVRKALKTLKYRTPQPVVYVYNFNQVRRVTNSEVRPKVYILCKRLIAQNVILRSPKC